MIGLPPKGFYDKNNKKMVPWAPRYIFKTCYSNPRFAKELCQMVFSKKELAVFDWKNLKAEKDTFQGLRADLVFSVPFKNKPARKAKLCLLLEHRSRFSRWIYHQILKYKTLIIGKSLEETEEDCLVIAVVFYHGKDLGSGKNPLRKGYGGVFCQKFLLLWNKDVLDYGIRVLDTHDP